MSLFSGKDEGLMGVDISATGIKLVELARSRTGFELKLMSILPSPLDGMVENRIIDSMSSQQALLDAVEAARPSTRNVAFAVSGNAVIIKTIAMQTMTEFELESQIRFEADQHVPYDIDDVYLDFQILGKSRDSADEMDVVLVACKREVVEDFQLVFNEAGLQSVCVDCAVFALENAAELTDEHGLYSEAEEPLPEDAQVHALVNIGAQLMNINVQINGQMSFVRDQFYGGHHLTEDIQKEHRISYQAAEQMKLENFSGIGPDALERFYVGLTAELIRSLDFYAANHAEFPVQRILLSGGTALVPGIAGEIEQRLGIETAVLRPFRNIKVKDSRFDADYLERIGPMMAVPIGLALRGFDK